MATTVARRSARATRTRDGGPFLGRQQQQQQPCTSSSSSEDCNNGSSSSGSEDEHGTDPMDVCSGYVSFPHAGVAAAAAVAAHSRNRRIGRSMHEGDDEGRPSSKRVKRVVPQPQAADYEECQEDELCGDNCDEDNDDDDDDEAEEEEGSRATRGRRAKKKERAPSKGGGRSGASASFVPATRPWRGGCGGDGDDNDDDDDNNDPDPPPPPPPAPLAAAPVRMSKCWLCTFSNSKVARQIAGFVSSNAGTMDPAIMADQIKREVLRQVRVFCEEGVYALH